MVSATSRRLAATPLILLLLFSTTNAQYTLRGRVVHDHSHAHRNSLSRRADPPLPAESAEASSGADTDKSTGEDDSTPQPAASESTEADKGEKGGVPAIGDDGDAGDGASGDEDKDGEDKAPVCSCLDTRSI